MNIKGNAPDKYLIPLDKSSLLVAILYFRFLNSDFRLKTATENCLLFIDYKDQLLF